MPSRAKHSRAPAMIRRLVLSGAASFVIDGLSLTGIAFQN
jgi:hypothetical protein